MSESKSPWGQKPDLPEGPAAIDVTQLKCPKCGQCILSSFEEGLAVPAGIPKPGQYAICAGCDASLAFVEGEPLGLRLLNEAEAAHVARSPQAALLRAARSAHAMLTSSPDRVAEMKKSFQEVGEKLKAALEGVSNVEKQAHLIVAMLEVIEARAAGDPTKRQALIRNAAAALQLMGQTGSSLDSIFHKMGEMP